VLCSCLKLAACSDKWLEGEGEFFFANLLHFILLAFECPHCGEICQLEDMHVISTSGAIHLLLTLPIGGY
jgi:hypothetical protein